MLNQRALALAIWLLLPPWQWFEVMASKQTDSFKVQENIILSA